MNGIAERFITLTNAGGTYTIPSADVYSLYLFTGTATLAAPYTVTSATPTRTTSFAFFYDGNVTTSGVNVVSFFGTALTAEQALRGKLYIIVTYNLTSPIGWKVTICDASGSTETHDLQGSFAAARVGDFKIKMGYAGTVNQIYAYAIEAVGAVDAGTITPKNNAGTTMTGGVITYPLSSIRGTAFTNTVTANNSFIAGDVLTFTFAKTTANGGEVLLSIKTTRLP